MDKSKILLITFFFCAAQLAAQKKTILSSSFELRYVTADEKANGETDYKGATEFLTTNQRVEYLHNWADYATTCFNDKNLDQQAVTDDEVAEAMKCIKAQPLPQVRQQIRLDEWKWTGMKMSKSKADTLGNTYQFTPQEWRFRLEMDVNGTGAVKLMDDGTIVCEYQNDGVSHHLVFEVDLTPDERRYNLYVDNKLLVDFQPLLTAQGGVDRLIADSENGLVMDNIWGVGYKKTTDTKRLNQPMFASTFIDVSSKPCPDTDKWMCTDYDDSLWESCTMPKNHGTERHKGEALLLRKWVKVGEFEKAYFELESLFPSGELWINGKVASVMNDSHRQWVDVTKYLKPDSDNLIALRIDPFQANFKQMMHHTPTDPNIGWFAGRSTLHLTKSTMIEDLYVYATSVKVNDEERRNERKGGKHQQGEENSDEAEVTAEVTVRNTTHTFYRGKLQVLLSEWFPTEGDEWVADSLQIVMQPQESRTFKLRFKVNNAKLWSWRTPQLYQVRALLINSISGKQTESFAAIDGDLARSRERYVSKLTDDFVVTTGFRTIEQEGGTFCINGKPELLRAPLYFGQRFPLETNALNILSPKTEEILRELLAVKKMNGNGMRMHTHWSDDHPQDGTNDPRFAEIADQLGLMYIWQTASWIRLRSPLVADFEGMATDVRQVRNAPSIVIWQPSNHPDMTDWEVAMAYWHKVYDAIYPNDTTRLITPTADFRHTRVYNDEGTRDNRRRPVEYCDPVWTANRISRGSMDYPTGFGQDWEYLRRWPFPHKWKGNPDIHSFLTSKHRAYFNFEQEESIGQMNWTLFKGKPNYKFHSYEWEYDKGSIGRLLTTDEWRESQAWQAFSAYECIRKMRWLDYDGLSWCCMWGGGNMGTYQKPLVDALGHKKLAYYAHRMGFQQILAGSRDVDMVYGTADKPTITVLNLGEEQRVTVNVSVKNLQGKRVHRQTFKGVILPAGRTATDVGTLQLPTLPNGYYFIEYEVNKFN